MIRPTDRHALKLPNNRMLTKASAVFVLFPTHIRYSHQMHNQSNELKVRNSATSRRHSILPKAAQTRHSTRYDVDCALTRPTTGRCSCPASLVSRNFFAVGPGCAKCFVFCCAPLGAATFRRGQRTPPRVFFFAPAPGKGRGRRSPVPARGQRASPSLPFPGAGAKKNTQGVFFFCCGPARTLTHSLRAWVAMPPPRRGGVFFLLRPCPDRGGVFFLLWPRPDAHSLTVGWGDFGKARAVFFFAPAPPGLFRQ